MVKYIFNFFLVLVSLVVGLYTFFAAEWIYPVMSIGASIERATSFEIFINEGNGFSPNDVKRFSSPGDNIFKKYNYPLYYDQVDSIRIDPSKTPGQFIIHSVTFRYGYSSEELKGESLLGRIVDVNHIDGLKVENGEVVGTATGHDPYVELRTPELTRQKSPMGNRLILGTATVLFFGLSVLLFLKFEGSLVFASYLLVVVAVFGDRIESYRIFSIYQFLNFKVISELIMCIGMGVLFSWSINSWSSRPGVDERDRKTLVRSFYPAIAVLLLGGFGLPAYKWLFGSVSIMFILFFGGTITNRLREISKGLIADEDGVPPTWLPAFRAGIFIVFAILIIGRAPSLISDPRIWAEDGVHSLVAFYHAENWRDWLYYEEYFRILSNFAGILSTHVFQLEQAGTVFTLVSLTVKLVAFYIVITGKSAIWNTIPKKILICLVLLYAPTSKEIWLNVNGSHYYMALITVLLLLEIENATSRVRSFFNYSLVGIASLSGVLPCALAPLYCLRAIQIRNRKMYIAAAVITVGTITQICLILFYEGKTPPRSSLTTFDMAGWIIYIKNVLLPFSEYWARTGFEQSRKAAVYIGQFSLGELLLIGYLLLVLSLSWVLRRSNTVYLLLGSVILVIMMLLFAIGGENQKVLRHPLVGNRYCFVPNALFLMTLIAAVQQIGRHFGQRGISASSFVLAVVSAFVLSNNVSTFYQHSPLIRGLPRWAPEMEKWREDQRHRLTIWPRGWALDFRQKPPGWGLGFQSKE